MEDKNLIGFRKIAPEMSGSESVEDWFSEFKTKAGEIFKGAKEVTWQQYCPHHDKIIQLSTEPERNQCEVCIKERLKKMKLLIEKIEVYRDGGTVLVRTNLGDYCIDGRIMDDEDNNVIDNPTKNMLFFGHPSKEIQLELEESKKIKKLLKSAIKLYDGINKEVGLMAINSIKISKL